ncbi:MULTISPECIES: polyprenyl synthetase family protein [Roseivirga]|jgi:octaprenyl-diphosphate synthase|uniref:Polyprenyl synthetase n=1 Tax=Roseivirga spongicola TaxID=333140 RepID=A0A150X8W6_9BACT|nr:MULTISPECIES: polyprenyl synthetase family protein [Roseivirga]PWL27570.1 MAG: polyprenyl synthetase family protein [Roseivirga sp. XM-24bin3]KYG75168.1 polyprenyl synthetase [Roseivirga spongicola]MBO6496127.1 polyprenyl synthetase family protein [Roseivirga sp.]MBO6662045.1 polyprenyl synthetase family protein [Roseivirga sp.]MBO6909366.1 polyprenyl synthetase family protein [Roseivirga sp.]
MALQLKEIQAPIASEMVDFEEKFRSFMKSKVFLLDKIMSYIVKRKGKQMRPMFVFLSAGAAGSITDRTYRGASLIELLHTATLVHDDVVDDSDFRRGFFSINALWKNKIAVLVGDYLLSRGLLLSVDNEDFDLLKIVSEAVREMSEGELLQMAKARNLDITEEIYYEVIRQKTASLIASCCAVGAASTGADKETVQKMREFGLNVGMAFQIKDDLFDYGTNEIGKPLGIDIKEKKMTLPLIYALQKASASDRRRIKRIVKSNKQTNKKVQEVIDYVKASGGIDYAKGVMQEYYEKSRNLLMEFPDSKYRQSLLDLVQFTIERSK